jgi:hypothetical protein
MEMINRAIEGASDYAEFQRRLISDAVVDRKPPAQVIVKVPPQSPRRPGENREQHRARLRAASEASKTSA